MRSIKCCIAQCIVVEATNEMVGVGIGSFLSVMGGKYADQAEDHASPVVEYEGRAVMVCQSGFNLLRGLPQVSCTIRIEKTLADIQNTVDDD